MKDRIHKKILEKCDGLVSWYEGKLENTYVPFYSSFDVRDAGFKIGNVDGNVFPAGFNNICQMDKDHAPEAMQKYMEHFFPGAKKVLLLTEDHLKNPYYWENAITISDLLNEAGYTVQTGMLSDEIKNHQELQSFSGKTIQVRHVLSADGSLQVEGFQPDVVISNNDFSNAYQDVDFSKTKMTPFKELGWYQRKKHSYFEGYNKYAEEFANLLDEDPWFFTVDTQFFGSFDVTDESSRAALAQVVESRLDIIRAKYKEHNISEDPYVFIKNNAGTYGLAVIKATSGDDVLGWNYKSKKKMKAAKGGRSVDEVIVQEGIPSALTQDDATAEPVIYMVGKELVGGFLRTHEKKDSRESLNSPGAVYKRLCLSDLKVRMEGCVLENVYGWVAKLGLLSIVEESKKLKNTF